MTTPTYAIAMAAGRDAGNRSAARAGRTAWNEADHAAACAVAASLLALVPQQVAA